MIPLPLAIKKLVPGYVAKWRERYRALIDEIGVRAPALEFGTDNGSPWLGDPANGIRIFGFPTEPENAEVYNLLRGVLPRQMPEFHFRLMKDYVSRYVYPHMRPDLKPEGYISEQLWGFHGQHKDAIADQPSADDRKRLMQAFCPKPDDVIVNGGAFIGIGDLRMSRDLSAGRIVAIEANLACFELLRRNLEYNRVGNVLPLHRGLWSGRGTLDLEVGYAQANSLVAEVHKGNSTRLVETISVDELVEELRLPRVTMLSLTLNGAEVETLDGAAKTLTEMRPRIRLAGWYKRNDVPIWKIAKEKIERCDYDVFVGPRGNLMALPRA